MACCVGGPESFWSDDPCGIIYSLRELFDFIDPSLAHLLRSKFGVGLFGLWHGYCFRLRLRLNSAYVMVCNTHIPTLENPTPLQATLLDPAEVSFV
mgnify:CR=1 FL=1